MSELGLRTDVVCGGGPWSLEESELAVRDQLQGGRFALWGQQ